MPERSRRAMHRPPRPRGRILVGPLLLGLVLFGTGEALGQQNLGHKVLGGVGIDAGTQVEPGLYFAGRVLHFGADELRDRDGDPVPLEGLDIVASACEQREEAAPTTEMPRTEAPAVEPIDEVQADLFDARRSFVKGGSRRRRRQHPGRAAAPAGSRAAGGPGREHGPRSLRDRDGRPRAPGPERQHRVGRAARQRDGDHRLRHGAVEF